MIDKANFIPTLESMDPNLFALNWDVVIEVFLAIIILAFFLERALAVLFESGWFLQWEMRRQSEDKSSFKSLIAFAVSATGCVLWQFDALSIILLRENMTILGSIITGAVVAGGSKASIKLFRDILGVHSKAYARIRLHANEATHDQLIDKKSDVQ